MKPTKKLSIGLNKVDMMHKTSDSKAYCRSKSTCKKI